MTAPFMRGERLPGLSCAPVTLEQVRAYVEASGDDNPIHVDELAAARAGLHGIILPGMLIAAQFPRLLRAWNTSNRLTSLDVRFLGPLKIGRAFRIEGRIVAVDDNGSRAVVRMTVQ